LITRRAIKEDGEVTAAERKQQEDRTDREHPEYRAVKAGNEDDIAKVQLNIAVARIAESLVGGGYYLGGNIPTTEGGPGSDCSGTALFCAGKVSGSKIKDRNVNGMMMDPNLLVKGSGGPGSLDVYDLEGDGIYDHVTIVANNGKEVHPSSSSGTIKLVEHGSLDSYFSEKRNMEFNWQYIF